MAAQHTRSRETTTQCVVCGLAMNGASPFAERWYWRSDGCGGLISVCSDCARDMHEPEFERRRGK